MAKAPKKASQIHDDIVGWVGGMKYDEDREALEAHADDYLSDYRDTLEQEFLLIVTPETPSRFHATPAQVDAYLRSILAEDTYQRYLWAVGDAAAHQVIDDVKKITEHDLEHWDGPKIDVIVRVIETNMHYPNVSTEIGRTGD